MRLLHQIITVLIVALGCLHIGFTPFNYSRFDMDAMWFVGAGVAIILTGFLNVAVIREAGKDPVVRTLCVISNVSFTLLFGDRPISVGSTTGIRRSGALWCGRCLCSFPEPRPRKRFSLTLDLTPECRLI